MEQVLAGKCALVTGTTGGLGGHFALTLARAGAKVALAERRVRDPNPLVEQIRAEGGTAAAVRLDVTDAESVRAGFEEAAAKLGPVSVLVNNAGLAVTKPLLEQTEEDWQSVIDVNLNGAWRVAQAAARHMVAWGVSGSIINITSIVGLRVAGQVPAYVASKAALTHLTRAMALELARNKIRVNALAPGYVETGINREFFASEAGLALIKRIPQRRIGRPEELDGPLLLLASDASSYMTGSVLVVDGGHLTSSL
ncbi:MAG: glucose 1-dehydrogenase [Rhodocyclaceae bacterium]|nr:glucose 1-dehydrogenase [Rhodocyclaceae bacterium]MBX3669180.1 glucose 1-dehydrogenase [Rhodocyclaceae bacterium]